MSTATMPAPRAAWTAASAEHPRAAKPFWREYLLPLLVVAAGIFAAWISYAQFLDVARSLWYSPIHDRNAHYWNALNVAIDLRTGNLPHLLRDVHSARVWGPLHAFLTGPVLAVGGLDYRLAVLPSLAAWVLTALFAFLLTRRAVPQGGNVAGVLAALFVLASPAERAFATDIMIESLGGCLSLACLYFCVRALEEQKAWPARLFGLTLTLLFFTKYNYWLLALLGIAAFAFTSRPKFYFHAVQAFVQTWSWKAWLRAQVRHPVNYLLAGVLSVLAFLAVTDADTLHIGAWRISTQSPHNLIHIAFVLFCIRLWPWWWKSGRVQARSLPCPARQLVYWHAWPVVVWFLWPQRLGYFLWYMTRNHGHDGQYLPWLGGSMYYWQCLADHYHQGLLFAALAVGLAVLGLLTWTWTKPTGRVIFWFLLIAVAMTVYHPTLRSRFIHSWIPILWVTAGVGLANALALLFRNSLPTLRQALAGVAVGFLGVVLAIGLVQQPPHAPEGGAKAGRPSTRDLTDAFLPELADACHAVILTNRPLKFLTGAAYMEKFGRHDTVETDLRGFGASPEANRQAFGQWLGKTRADAVVFVHLPPGSPLYEDISYPNYDQFRDFMKEQTTFRPQRKWHVPGHGDVEITLWQRAPSASR